MLKAKPVWGIVLAVTLLSPLLHAQPRHFPEAMVKQTAPLVPEEPGGIGPPCADRASWSKVAGRFTENIRAAETALKSPIPAWNDDDYLDFSSRIASHRVSVHAPRTSIRVPAVPIAE